MKFIFTTLLLGVCVLGKNEENLVSKEGIDQRSANLPWQAQQLARLKVLLQKNLDLSEEKIADVMEQAMQPKDSSQKPQEPDRPISLVDLNFKEILVLNRNFSSKNTCKITIPIDSITYKFDQCGHYKK
ncbi:hypothetical protein TcasGA2_TC034267 [Tribolium castaneum]|uniref:Uncharacterized protein n=1 Tax=Tribolium castaneum TaxID=7070 RepID=A0A139WCI7_TRICA|nr:hypothetical protein TcasGA2_TC034267 [Tribolium castaneum]